MQGEVDCRIMPGLFYCFNSDTAVPPILEERIERETRDNRWKFLDMVGANMSRHKSALRRGGLKALFVILAWIPIRSSADAGDAVCDDAPRKELHRELAVLRFLHGPSGGGGEGGRLLVPIGAGAGQEVRRTRPGDRRMERHRTRAYATCMIWFVCFISHISL